MDDPELTIMYSVRQVGGIGGSDLGGRKGDKEFSASGRRFAELWGRGVVTVAESLFLFSI